jgi:type I restriction enzyme S subunit
VLELQYGKALKESDRIPGPVPVYGSNGPVGSHHEALVKGPGIVIGRKGNTGTVKFANSDFYPIDTTFYVKLKTAQADAMNYYYHLLVFQDLRKLSSDSAVPGLNRNIVYMNQAVIAPERVIGVRG